jgi:hypothetical protein
MNRIEDLLNRYWQCETSVEEERELRRYFAGGNIPDDIAQYNALFAWQSQAASIKTEKTISLPAKKMPRIGFYSIIKVAAIVLIFLTIGTGFYTHYQQSSKVDQVLSETYSDPQDAIRETEEVVAKVSSLLLQIEEANKSETDSLAIEP